MAQDLRSYLDLVKRTRPADFQIVSKEVDPAYEITALVVKLEREGRRRPVLIFERVKGTPFPVLTNLHASRRAWPLAMGAAPDGDAGDLPARDGQADRRRASSRPAPCKDVVLTGDRVNLVRPAPDPPPRGRRRRLLTAAISFAKDPTSETWNCAYNRLMIKGRDTHVDPPDRWASTSGSSSASPRRAASRCRWPSPSACTRPSRSARSPSAPSTRTSARSWARSSASRSSWSSARPPTCWCPPTPRWSSRREILPGARTPEGPFGEFTGYSLGERQREVVQRQRDHPPAGRRCSRTSRSAHLDHMLLSTIPMEANLYRAVRAMVPSVKAVRVPGALHLLRLDRAAADRPGQERDPGRARRRPLHEARGGGRPRRGHLRRPPGQLGDRHALPARPRHHDHHPRARLRPRSRPPARTATPPSGAWTRPPSHSLAAYTPRHRVPPEVWQRLRLEDYLG